MNTSPIVSAATSLLFTPHCPHCQVWLSPEQAMCFDCFWEYVEPTIVYDTERDER